MEYNSGSVVLLGSCYFCMLAQVSINIANIERDTTIRHESTTHIVPGEGYVPRIRDSLHLSGRILDETGYSTQHSRFFLLTHVGF